MLATREPLSSFDFAINQIINELRLQHSSHCKEIPFDQNSIKLSLIKFYDLVKARNTEEIDNLTKSDRVQLNPINWVAKLLARERDVDSVNFLLNKKYCTHHDAVFGYAWGAHMDLMKLAKPKNAGNHDEISGLAFGMHLDAINDITANIKNKYSMPTYTIVGNYVGGGHLNEFDSALEVITRTKHPELRKSIILELSEFEDLQVRYTTEDITRLVAKSNKLLMLMDEHNSTYLEALAIVNDVEKCKERDPQRKLSANSVFAISLFNQAASFKLNQFQHKAVNDFKQLGMTENMIMDWVPDAYIGCCFSRQHYDAIKFLLTAVNPPLTPENAIKEINQLNQYQVTALIKLYNKNLRGSHLRQWNTEHREQVFSEENLYQLLEKCRDNNVSPNEALITLTGRHLKL